MMAFAQHHLVEPAGLKEALPLVGRDVWRTGAACARHFVQRDILAGIGGPEEKVIATLHTVNVGQSA